MQEVREGGEVVCVFVCVGVFVFECGLATKENPCRIRAAFATPIKSQSHVGNALALVHHWETEQLLFWLPSPILVLFASVCACVCSRFVLFYGCPAVLLYPWKRASHHAFYYDKLRFCGSPRPASPRHALPQLPYRCLGPACHNSALCLC